MFQNSGQVLLFVVDVSVKAALLALVAGLAMKLLRLRDSNIRHRVWSGILIGMLALPILTLVLPTLPLSVPERLSNLATVRTVPVKSVGNPVESTFPRSTSDAFPRESQTSTRHHSDSETTSSANSGSRTASTENSTTSSVDSGSEYAGGGVIRQSPGVFQSGAAFLLIGWVIVSSLFGVRILTGLWSSTLLRHRAKVIREDDLQCCLSALSGGFVRKTTTIRETAAVCVPVTVGWLRPTVLLPMEWRTWSREKRNAIVTHELTHIARRDFAVAVAAELNRCLYWFHPVSWWLRNQLSDLAEEACDDAAIGQTGDRTGYARHLLEVAGQLAHWRGRRVQPGLSMAKTSNVESRIDSILDFKRPLSRRMSWSTGAVIAMVAIPLIATAAAVRPVASGDMQENAADESSANSVRVFGQVTDIDGKPIPNATVEVWRSRRPDWYAADPISTFVSSLKLDAEGRFDQQIPGEHLPNGGLRSNAWSVLVASAPGHAIRTMVGDTRFFGSDEKPVEQPNFLKQRVTIQLPEAVSIQGRCLTVDGQPVSGARVGVHQLLRAEPNKLDAWLEKAASRPPRVDLEGMLPNGMVTPAMFFPAVQMHVPVELVKPVITDADGRFEFRQLVGRDDLAVLRFQEPNIVDKTAHVVGRDTKTVYGVQSTRFSFQGAYYGREFDLVAEPSVPVFGVVRDRQSREPLANVSVAISTIYGATMSQEGRIRTTTDQKGRYRIEGLPIPPENTSSDRANSLAARFGDLPYIESSSLAIPVGDGSSPIEFNIEFRKAAMAKGRLTNKSTGQPVASAEIYYTPYSNFETTSKYRRYADNSMEMLGNSSRYHTDEDGNFAIPVIPGRGVIAATIRDGEYVRGFGAEEIEVFKNMEPGGIAIEFADGLVPSSFHSLVEIDVPADVSTHRVDMQVDSGFSMVVRFVDQHDQPLTGVRSVGVASNSRWTTIESDQALATGLVNGGIRSVRAMHPGRNLVSYTRLVPEEGQKEVTIKLWPLGQVTGRIVDSEGIPLAGAVIQANHQNNPDFQASESPMATDENGRFTYYLPVGTTYEITVLAEGYEVNVVATDLEMNKPQRLDYGDLAISDNADSYDPVKASRKPIVTEIPHEELKTGDVGRD